MRASLEMDERVRSGVASAGAVRALSVAGTSRAGASVRGASVKGPAEAEWIDAVEEEEEGGDGSGSEPSLTGEQAESALRDVFALPGDKEARVKKRSEVGLPAVRRAAGPKSRLLTR